MRSVPLPQPKASRVILAFAPGIWAYPEFAGSPRYLLWELARHGWRVLYVEPPKRFQFVTKTWNAPDRDFTVITPGGVPPFGVRAIPSESIGDKWRRKTSERLWTVGKDTANAMELDVDAYWFGAPWHSIIAEEAKSYLPGALLVSHTYDELSASPALSPDQRRILWDWERELARLMDLSVCSSEPQARRRAGIAANTLQLDNGVSETHLPHARKPPSPRATELAAQVQSLPAPRIVYGGTVDHRLDTSIFQILATSFSQGSLVFCGHIDDSFPAASMALLKSLTGVHFLGDVPYSAFPWLYDHASVLVIGHRRDEFTDAMNPEKLIEYLASGKPVVSVGLPEVRRASLDLKSPGAILFADTPAEFVAACQQAMKEDSKQKIEARQSLARRRTWESLGERLAREIDLRLREKYALSRGQRAPLMDSEPLP